MCICAEREMVVVDDSMAILSAFNSREEVEVIALTTLYGNVPTRMATENAVFLAHMADRKDLVVYEGAKTSLRGAAKERIADFVHGSDGFGNTGQHVRQVVERNPDAVGRQSAAECIVECARKYPGEVTVLALAALTNVALAIQLEPKLPQLLKKVVVLGGAFQINGNVNPAAEANIYGDPDAANVVFSRCPTCYLLGLDVTHTCILTTAEIDALQGAGKYGSFLRDITQFYLEYHRCVSMIVMALVLPCTAAMAVCVLCDVGRCIPWRGSFSMMRLHLRLLCAQNCLNGIKEKLWWWQMDQQRAIPSWIDVRACDGCDDRVLKALLGHTRVDGCMVCVVSAVERDWIGGNAWDDCETIHVALGCNQSEIVNFVKERMTR